MNISYNWLISYLSAETSDITLELTPQKVADILTNIGLEVEEVTKTASVPGGLKGLVIGEVKRVGRHPNADRLKLTKVNIGPGADLQIVCGAPNVAEDQKVIVAPVGTTIYPISAEPFEIKEAKIRGEQSSGMICAEDEIGLGESHEGIMVLPPSAPIGQLASEYFQVKEDHILEVGLTPNRADAHSHLGVARDLAAWLSVHSGSTIKVNYPVLTPFHVDAHTFPVEVEILDENACPRYSGITLTDVKVQESPQWLQDKLRAIGIKPINNVVDVTNFVLHEFGHPLHAFDANKIEGQKIIVRKEKEGTPFIALNGEKRKLTADDLMICDKNGGLCIAGVYGGAGSGVTEKTASVFLESAYFNPVSIRKTAAHHNLRTDAAIHFEKGVDPNQTIDVLKRAALLIKELGQANIASEIVDVYPKKANPVEIDFDLDYLHKLAGTKMDTALVVRIFQALGIMILDEEPGHLKVSVPTFKNEVTRPADLAEEILRIYGYDKIPYPQFFTTALETGDHHPDLPYENNVAAYLTSSGFFEMVKLSLTNSNYYKKILSTKEENLVDLHNSLSADLDILRPDLLATGLEAVAYNVNRRNLNLKLFEFGRKYLKVRNGYLENDSLALIMSGGLQHENWKGSSHKADFFAIKAEVLNVLERMGISGYKLKELENPAYQYGLQLMVQNKPAGHFGLISPKITRAFDVKQEVFFAELNRGLLLTAAKKQQVKVKPIPKFPSIRRDLALVIERNIKYREIEKIAAQQSKQLLKDINLFDIFEDEAKLGKGKKSYAVSFVFQHKERTLQDKEVDQMMQQLMVRYKKELDATIRQ